MGGVQLARSSAHCIATAISDYLGPLLGCYAKPQK